MSETPARMPVIDRLPGNLSLRKAIWKLWYPFLTRRLHDEGVTFLNYAYETDPPMAIPLAPEEEKDRACIQLYHHAGSLTDLCGKAVLEVSCGHGGGRVLRRARQRRGLALPPGFPAFLHQHGRDFACVKGSRVYNALVEGKLSYRSYLFGKR